MAGDLPFAESVVVQEQADVGVADALTERINDTGGRVLHRFGPRVLIGRLTEGTRLQVSDLGGARVAAAVSAPDPADLGDLDDTGRLGLRALRLRESTEFIRAKANRPFDGQAWDAAGATPPDAHDEAGSAGAPQAPTATTLPTANAAELVGQAAELPTSARMTGVTAVGLIFVQGPTDDLRFTAAEQEKVVAEVQNGLGWLATMEPSGSLSWSYEIRQAAITTTRGPDNLSFTQQEERWRNPAMEKLGFSPDFAGVTAYVRDLRARLATEWAYCAFFTKYPVGHFAYASIGGPRLVMDHTVDGWGIDNLDRIFAHETGHIFGAPDEYADSRCNCGEAWGFYGKPNVNCATCAPNGGVACIMKMSDWTMCTWTPAHLGFGPVPLVTQFSGKVVHIAGNSGVAGAKAVQSAWNGGRYQQFRADPVDGGHVRLVSLDSGLVLAVAGASTDNGAHLIQEVWSGADHQQFRAEPLGDTYYRIVAKHSGKVLDVTGGSSADGAQIVQWPWSGVGNQRWRWLWGAIRAKHSNKVLDVPAGSTADDIAIAQDDGHGGTNQQFRLDPVGDGWCRIVAQHSTKVLAVASASTADGAKIVQQNWSGADHQLFRFEAQDDGHYRIVAKHSTKVLAVPGSATASRTEVVQTTWTGGDNQRWRL